MDWIEVTRGDNRSSKCYEMFASVDMHTVSTNSLASSTMTDLFGSADYDLKLVASSCGEFVGIKAETSSRVKLNPQKQITAKPIYEMMKIANNAKYLNRKRYKLELIGGMLVFNVKRPMS